MRVIGFVIWRTIVESWNGSIFGRSAQAAFWQTLSLPPLLLGLLGTIGYIGGLFGPDTIDIVHSRIIGFANRTFSEDVVTQIISPTVDNVLGRGRAEIISVGFVLSLWAGSSAVSSFVDSIVAAHDQHTVRNPVWQRIFALGLYVFFLIGAVFVLPMVALGPTYIGRIVPDSWHPLSTHIIEYGYFPAVGLLLVIALTTLYRVALPKPLPWHRLMIGAILAGVVFWCASTILRIYLAYVTSTGYTYGALAAPIAFLLFTFFLGFSVILGAELNAVIQQMWPAGPTHVDQVRDWMAAQTADISEQIKVWPTKLPTGPIRRTSSPHPSDSARSPQSRAPEPCAPASSVPDNDRIHADAGRRSETSGPDTAGSTPDARIRRPGSSDPGIPGTRTAMPGRRRLVTDRARSQGPAHGSPAAPEGRPRRRVEQHTPYDPRTPDDRRAPDD
ncbi:hypothetical protein GCM10027169_37980 [Gordonia jinhuaensis]|uniref:YihY family inner membrane protein n=1 Tax=Gordonia jinhuaensis TaxID=1517702 RepID=A0A916T2K0_9ACTN|nr:YihY/virulence factor BrkB family protein [Gordonia jinhuaensis]GGB25793.1 hypothetical protein GCM10011489_12450 [Gordonia jinhuaensis]